MKIALLTTDSREHFGDYMNPIPYFGTAPQSLLSGFACMAEGHEMRNGKCEMWKTSAGALCAKGSGRMFGAGHTTGAKRSDAEGPKPRRSTPLEIHVISCSQRRMESPEKLADNIWFHSLHVPKWGWLRSGYLGCILAVLKKLREIQPDLVHAQGTERDCAISAIFTPYPKLLTIHGNLRLIKKAVGFRSFSAPWLQSFIEGFVVPRFDGIICITNYTKQAVEHEAKKTWVVPNAVDPAFLELGEERDKRKAESGNLKPEDGKLKAETGNRESENAFSSFQPSSLKSQVSSPPQASALPPPIVLVVANVDARKNQNAFIRALDPLALELPFLVKFFGRCGEDGYGKEFQALVAERAWCHYGGMVGREVLRDEFAKATALALPTHEDNCPMVVLEAQAAGIPIMASNVGGVPDLVEDGVTGLLTDPDRPETMRGAVKRLLEDGELPERLAQKGREQAVQRFRPEVIARRHLEIYREMLHVGSDQ